MHTTEGVNGTTKNRGSLVRFASNANTSRQTCPRPLPPPRNQSEPPHVGIYEDCSGWTLFC